MPISSSTPSMAGNMPPSTPSTSGTTQPTSAGSRPLSIDEKEFKDRGLPKTPVQPVAKSPSSGNTDSENETAQLLSEDEPSGDAAQSTPAETNNNNLAVTVVEAETVPFNLLPLPEEATTSLQHDSALQAGTDPQPPANGRTFPTDGDSSYDWMSYGVVDLEPSLTNALIRKNETADSEYEERKDNLLSDPNELLGLDAETNDRQLMNYFPRLNLPSPTHSSTVSSPQHGSASPAQTAFLPNADDETFGVPASDANQHTAPDQRPLPAASSNVETTVFIEGDTAQSEKRHDGSAYDDGARSLHLRQAGREGEEAISPSKKRAKARSGRPKRLNSIESGGSVVEDKEPPSTSTINGPSKQDEKQKDLSNVYRCGRKVRSSRSASETNRPSKWEDEKQKPLAEAPKSAKRAPRSALYKMGVRGVSKSPDSHSSDVPGAPPAKQRTTFNSEGRLDPFYHSSLIDSCSARRESHQQKEELASTGTAPPPINDVGRRPKRKRKD